MIGVVCPDGSAWSYIYDPFGRRTEKRLLRRGDSYPTAMTRYLWDGNVIAAEMPDGDMGRAVWWHYEPDGFTPLLREEAGQILHVIADHLGTPRELVDESGQVVWSITHRLWGGARGIWTSVGGGNAAPDLSVDWTPPERADPRNLCPIRFQGQWEDPETGLHYNRFRIYDPTSAQYLSPDPIGLMRGLRAAGYVEAPTDFVDPIGLNRLRGNLIAVGQGLNVPWQAHHLIPCAVWGRHRSMFNTLGMSRDAAANGIALPSDRTNIQNPNLPIHSGSHAQYNARNETAVSGIEQRWRTRRSCAKTAQQRAAADRLAKTELQQLQTLNRSIINSLGPLPMAQCP